MQRKTADYMPTELLDISVIVRTSNRPAMLARALRSIAQQTAQPQQVIVIDEGGTPGAVRALLNSEGSLHPKNVEVIENPAPAGRGAALNQGLAAAKTRWIAILDDDDTWSPEFLVKMLGWLERAGSSEQAVVSLTTMILEKEEGGAFRSLRSYPFNPPEYCAVTLHGLAGGSQFTINAFVYSRESALALGGYREDIPVQEDWEFNLRFVQKHRVGLIREALANYHLRPKVRTGAAANSSQVLHESVRQQLIDGWLRQELATGRFGLGQLCLQTGFQREFVALFRAKRRLLGLLRRLGLRRD